MDAGQHGVCTDCAHGTISAGYNAVSCTTCANGRYAVATETECSECQIGKYHEATGQECKTCDSGKFAEGMAATSCLHCPSGKYQDAAVYHECVACAYGTWTADSMVGLTECVSIPTPYPTPCNQKGDQLTDTPGVPCNQKNLPWAAFYEQGVRVTHM